MDFFIPRRIRGAGIYEEQACRYFNYLAAVPGRLWKRTGQDAGRRDPDVAVGAGIILARGAHADFVHFIVGVAGLSSSLPRAHIIQPTFSLAKTVTMPVSNSRHTVSLLFQCVAPNSVQSTGHYVYPERGDVLFDLPWVIILGIIVEGKNDVVVRRVDGRGSFSPGFFHRTGVGPVVISKENDVLFVHLTNRFQAAGQGVPRGLRGDIVRLIHQLVPEHIRLSR